MYCTQRSVESEHLFLAGKLFLCFFFLWIAWGNLQQQQQKKKCFGSFYIFFLEGAFLVLLLLLGSTWLSSSLSFFLSFFPGRASLEDGREGKKGEKGSIRYISRRFLFRPRREKREGHLEKSEEKVLVFFCIYIFIYFYV